VTPVTLLQDDASDADNEWVDDDAGVVGAHLAYLRHLNRRPGTIYQRRRHLERLAAFDADRPLLELDGETLHAFVTRSELGPEARASAVSHVCGFFRWAVLAGLLERDPSARLLRPRRPRRLPRPMPDAAAARALAQAAEPVRAWLYLAAYAGLRACEIAQLRGEDFLLGQTPAMLIVRESKGGDSSFVPISQVLRPVIVLYAMVDGWCFPNGRDPATHVTAAQVSKRANRFLHEIGVTETLHSLRHLFGTRTYAASGRDLRVTQELMRHKTPVSTAIYTFVDPGRAASVLDNLPGPGEGSVSGGN